MDSNGVAVAGPSGEVTPRVRAACFRAWSRLSVELLVRRRSSAQLGDSSDLFQPVLWRGEGGAGIDVRTS
ncbi:hypothetical protein chiPu_0013396 [Chiloscyllium punctatum]|uniref:Uncharacterized protein n=1 Tax=Chiloscyllium punctatum TaxID=137246 RepID=A0A401SWY9_CHIPU|nr:hypothetical protein [Chiloscyllium punctatum]